MGGSFWRGQKAVRVILGSRSPRRQELIRSIVPSELLTILPPSSPDEPGFDGLRLDAEIAERLLEIVRMKHALVRQQAEDRQLTSPDDSAPIIVAADTTVIAGELDGERVVLGQPGEPNWKDDVSTWMARYLSGRTHQVWTAIRVSRGNVFREQIVRSAVGFRPLSDNQIQWYLSIGESQGKAGGYAIQGMASVFVESVQGSLTNIIGLPLAEVVGLMDEVT
ncbi:MAG: Maf family protein [Planctomycetaceae bacterium]